MSVTSLLSSLLVAPERVTREILDASSPDDLAGAAEFEQVVPQAVAGLASAAADSPHLEAMRAAARRWSLYEALERRAVCEVLDAASGAPMLFFKGASLAYSVYAAPDERMRHDWDIVVPRPAFTGAENLLLQCGFRKAVQTPGTIRVRQQSYRRNLGHGECTIDLHADLFNPPGMAGRVRFEDLYPNAIPLASLHASARGTSASDALIIACLHRLVHHSADPRLIWDYDVRLLTRRLAPVFGDVMVRAAAWDAAEIVAAEIARVASRFGEPLPREVDDRIRGVGPPRHPFARSGRSRATEFVMDWRSLGWRERLSLARETFLPDPAFVRASTGSTRPLPWLYLQRLAKGAARWFRPSRRGGGE